jgi:hypothetical protein
MTMTLIFLAAAALMISAIAAISVSSSSVIAIATNSSPSESGCRRKSPASSKVRSPQLSPSSLSMSSIRRSKFCTFRLIVHATIGAGSGFNAAVLVMRPMSFPSQGSGVSFRRPRVMRVPTGCAGARGSGF